MKPILKSWLQSSADPEQVSNRVRGTILAFSSIIMFIALKFFHIELQTTDITSFATFGSAVIGGIWGIYGLIQGMVIRAGSVKG